MSENLYLMAATGSQYEILLTLLEHAIKPQPNIHERSKDDRGDPPQLLCSALGYALQSNGRDATTVRKCISLLLSKGAKADSIETCIHDGGRRDEGGRIVRVERHFAEYACARREMCAPLLDALGDAKLAALSKKHPLLGAAINANDENLVARLLDAGADINGLPPSRMAYHNESETLTRQPIANVRAKSMLSLLLMRGASLHTLDADGKSALQHLSSRGLSSEMIEMATQAAISQRLGLARGKKAPKHAARDDPNFMQALFDAVRSDQRENIKQMLKALGRGGAVNARLADGKNLLFPALEAGNFALCRQLIEAGVSVNERDALGVNPLMAFISLAAPSGRRAQRFGADKNGHRRSAMRETFFKHADWKSVDALGRPIVWPLWGDRLDTHANAADRINLAKYASLLAPPESPFFTDDSGAPNPMIRDSSGRPFILDACERLASGPLQNSSMAEIQAPWALRSLMATALASPELRPTEAREIALTLFGPKAEAGKLWARYSAGTDLVSGVNTDQALGELIERLLEKSADPKLPLLLNGTPLQKRFPGSAAILERAALGALNEPAPLAPRPKARSL